jgi:hypothetical protein
MERLRGQKKFKLPLVVYKTKDAEDQQIEVYLNEKDQ